MGQTLLFQEKLLLSVAAGVDATMRVHLEDQAVAVAQAHLIREEVAPLVKVIQAEAVKVAETLSAVAAAGLLREVLPAAEVAQTGNL